MPDRCAHCGSFATDLAGNMMHYSSCGRQYVNQSQNMYRNMEVVYKPAVQKLRDDMKRMRDLANQIYEIAKAHDYPEIATPTPVTFTEDSGSVATESSGAPGAATAYDSVDKDYERKGD